MAALGPVDVLFAEQDVASPAAPGRLTAVAADSPGEVAADDVACHSRGHDQDQVQVSPGDRAAGDRAAEQHRELRGHGDARGLGQHQNEDRQRR